MKIKYGVFNEFHFTAYGGKLTFDGDGTYEFYLRYGCKEPATYLFCRAYNTSGSIN